MFKCLNTKALGLVGRQNEIIELALTFGFSAIDIDITEYAARVETDGEANARRLLDSARLKAATFELPITWDVDDNGFRAELERFLPLGTLAKSLGAECCTAWIKAGSNERPYHDNFDFHQRRFNDLGQLLSSLGMTLALGVRAADEHRKPYTNAFLRDHKALATLVSMVNRPNVKMQLDLWDLLVGGGSLEEISEFNPEKIGVVRVSNIPSGDDIEVRKLTEADRLLPSLDGPIALGDILASLRARGVACPIVPCAGSNGTSGVRREAVVERAAKAIDGALSASKAA